MNWKRIVVREYGGPERLEIEELDTVPTPGRGEALIGIDAAGVGYTDTIVRRGKYIDYKGGLPVTPGYDLAGTVIALGEGVSAPAPGTTVCDMPMNGGYAQYAVLPAKDLIPVPQGVAPQDAVQVPLMYMTAYQMLTREVELKRGDAILVVGASGSVGRALVKLGVQRGLRVIGTASARNLDAVRTLGAEALDYRRPDLAQAIRLASGGGVMAAFDAIGGNSWTTSWLSLAKGGKLIGFGLQDYLDANAGLISAMASFARLKFGFPLRAALDRSGRTTGFYNILQRRRALPQEYREDAITVLDLFASGAISPDPVEVLSLEQAPEAHRRIAQGGMAHRLVIAPG
ncbi:alcohol dehydrogenase catalytic domain-containing protein [Novosphingobium pentaromativorans]|uniref:Enoyl reductase (ER) domain-containing protein n=1 Tax=Novosphingobium pentaromativorans US6-1 TaxID=1088721 RepID=G6ECJ8_9SPHN|nr:zinc-binding dehydrogenase [Novosphingobium pentaromativorans]AIT80036.1 hypothetical protein JI59_09740 [Novosphingobium pentaromativorans US6-1]EHJ60909.1 hypothetical protein NSU_2069 [Novosphingobium pentaromativorans US6-1]